MNNHTFVDSEGGLVFVVGPAFELATEVVIGLGLGLEPAPVPVPEPEPVPAPAPEPEPEPEPEPAPAPEPEPALVLEHEHEPGVMIADFVFAEVVVGFVAGAEVFDWGVGEFDAELEPVAYAETDSARLLSPQRADSEVVAAEVSVA